MKPYYNRHKPCPCGSGKKAKSCCNAIPDQWSKEPSILQPSSTSTNTQVAGCYLSVTNDCGGPLTREHYISHAILKQMSKNGASVVYGLPWTKDNQFTRVSNQSLTAKVLCKRHNEMLSPLDAKAAHLKEIIGRFIADFNSPSAIPEVAIVAGEDIERWMLKTLCGFVASKQADQYELQPLERWASVLIGKEPWPTEWGLYVQPENFQHHQHFSFETLKKPDGCIAMVKIPINNLGCVFAMPETLGGYKDGIYRPRFLHFKRGRIRKTLILSWQDQKHQQWIEFARAHPVSTESPGWPDFETRNLNA